MTGVPDDVLREKIMFIEGFREIYSRRMYTLNWRNFKTVGRGRYPVIEFDSIITSKIVIKGRVTSLLTLFVWYVFKTKERGTERRNLVPRALFPDFGGGAGKPPPKPGKSTLGTRLREACGISLRGGTLSDGLYGEAPPERGTFFRLQVYERVGISLVEVYQRVGKSVIWICKRGQKG